MTKGGIYCKPYFRRKKVLDEDLTVETYLKKKKEITIFRSNK